jgi:hypothetical protein
MEDDALPMPVDGAVLFPFSWKEKGSAAGVEPNMVSGRGTGDCMLYPDMGRSGTLPPR